MKEKPFETKCRRYLDKMGAYQLDGVATADLATVKAKVLAYNANIPAADRQIFISDDYDNSDPEEIIGELASISAAQYETVEYTRINLN